jgi:hypothetical protein
MHKLKTTGVMDEGAKQLLINADNFFFHSMSKGWWKELLQIFYYTIFFLLLWISF